MSPRRPCHDLSPAAAASPRLALLLLLPVFIAGAACRSAGPAPKPGDAAKKRAIDQSKLSFGVQLYSFRNQLEDDLEGTLAAIRAMGLEDVEVHSFFGHEPGPFAALLARHGLVPRTLSAGYERLQNDLQGVMGDARALGVTKVVCPWIPHEGDHYTAEDNEKAIALFAKAGAEMKAAGLHLFYHPHGYEFHDGGTGTPLLDQMIQRLEPGVVDFQMDVFWVTHAGADPVAYLERFPGRFQLFHLKEMKAGTPTGQTDGGEDLASQVTIGTGIIDFPAIIATAQAQGATGFFIEDESEASMQQVPRSLAYLRSL